MRRLFFLTFVILLVSNVGAELLVNYEFEGNYNPTIGTGTGVAYGGASIITDAQKGQVVSLDGVDDWIKIEPDDLMEDLTGAPGITVAAWIKTDTLDSYAMVVGKGYAWRLRGGSTLLGNTNKITFECMDTDPFGSEVTTDMIIADGQWHHLAGTYDGSEYKTSVDRIQNGPAVSATGSIAGALSYDFAIGAHYNHNDTENDPRRFFNGLIDDVRIYDDAQTLEQIQQWSGIPEPGTILLLGLGGLILRKKK